MDDSFESEIRRAVDTLAKQQRLSLEQSERKKEAWKVTVRQFREISREVITPTLREAAKALGVKGLRPVVIDSTRRALAVGMELDREETVAARLSFVLHSSARTVEALYLGASGAERLGLTALSGLDRPWVEEIVLAFLRRYFA